MSDADGRSRVNAGRLFPTLHWLSSLQFNFAGFFIAIGVMTGAASIVALAIVVFNSAAIEALLARGAARSSSSQSRAPLETFYSIGLVFPLLATVWCMIEHVRVGATAPAAWIVSAGACALGITLADSLVLARFRAKGIPVLGAAMPVLQQTAPFALAVILAGMLTGATQSFWPDFATAFLIICFHGNTPPLFRQIAALDRAALDVRDAAAFQLTLHHPRLAILLTEAWRESAGLVRKRDSSAGSTPEREMKRDGQLLSGPGLVPWPCRCRHRRSLAAVTFRFPSAVKS